MNTQFQLGFELTNILNPATQAISAINSIALVDAVRKAGSDVLTEVKLASILGKNCIAAKVGTHFRQAVAKSERSLISRYLEIALESGAGPTVQNALKDKALFSMIVQMSLLCTVHEHQPFANAMVESIERNARDFKGDPKAIPDYPSLLGTMRVIQRETVGFQWSGLFDSVERTIQNRLSKADPHPKPSRKRRRNKSTPLNLDRHSINDRGLSFPVLQALLLAFEPLQRFPEDRQIYIECGTGISTLVVWCNHVLDLSVKVCIEDREVTFGKEPFNVLIKEILSMKSTVSLIVPFSQDVPLFTLSSSERDPKFGPELRAKILGFGQAALKQVDVQPRDIIRASYSVIAGALASWNRGCSCTSFLWRKDLHEDRCRRTPRRFPGKCQIIETARIFFGLHEVDEAILKEVECTQAKSKTQKACAQLVPLLLSLSRVQQQDLAQGADVPFSIKVYQTRFKAETSSSGLFDMEFPNITESFEILAHYLLGQRYSDSFIKQALLVSDCGWSIFFDAIDATDPSDVSICNLRMLAGAPSVEDASKDRVVKDKVLDGPTELSFSYSDSTVLKADWFSNTSSVNFFPGVSTAKRGNSLIGFRDNDSFLATQSFTWKFKGTEAKIHLLGFREMLELCKDFMWLSPCACDDKITGLGSLEAGQVFTINGSHVDRILPKALKDHEGLNSEYAVCLFPNTRESTKADDATWIFHITKNPAARWLQMDDMVRNTLFWEKMEPQLFIRDNETCMRCACKYFSESGNRHPHSLVLL
jgi:hypothetical protein